jgi:hypothetical protein
MSGLDIPAGVGEQLAKAGRVTQQRDDPLGDDLATGLLVGHDVHDRVRLLVGKEADDDPHRFADADLGGLDDREFLDVAVGAQVHQAGQVGRVGVAPRAGAGGLGTRQDPVLLGPGAWAQALGRTPGGEFGGEPRVHEGGHLARLYGALLIGGESCLRFPHCGATLEDGKQRQPDEPALLRVFSTLSRIYLAGRFSTCRSP